MTRTWEAGTGEVRGLSVDEEAVGQLMRSLLTRQEEDAQRIAREIGGRQAMAAMGAMCSVAVARHFGESATPSEVAQFVSDICATHPNAQGVNRTLAEALVRFALGEEGILDGLDLTGMGATGAFIAGAIVETDHYSPEEMEAFIAEATEFAREGWAELARSQGDADG
jgi:hypothetical protein